MIRSASHAGDEDEAHGSEPSKSNILRDWVYAEKRLLSSYERDLSQSHAEAQLARELNNEKLIAVLGSGVSAGYGHPSWKALLGTMIYSIQQHCEALRERLVAKDPGIDISEGTRERARVVLEDIEAVLTLNPRNDPKIESKVKPAIEKLKGYATVKVIAHQLDTFVATGLRTPMSIDLERLSICFELCDNLFAAIRQWEGEIFNSQKDRHAIEHQAKKELRDWLRWRVSDERGRAGMLLKELRVAGLGKKVAGQPFGKGGSVVNSGGSNSKPSPFEKLPQSVRRNYVPKTNGELLAWLDRTINPPIADVSKATEAEDRLARIFSLVLYNTHAPLLATPASLVKDGEKWGALLLHKGLKRKRGRLSKLVCEHLDPDGGGADPELRAELVLTRMSMVDLGARMLGKSALMEWLWEIVDIAARLYSDPDQGSDGRSIEQHVRAARPRLFDPLAQMQENLGIRRMMTTNYDAEIDRLLESRSFREIENQDATTAFREGRSITQGIDRALYSDAAIRFSEIMSYEPGSAPQLYDFGSNSHANRQQVLHIHGRARSESSWLVLSEKDYRQRYANEDTRLKQSEDTMSLIFNANPLVFVGLGMTEPDILRPLRLFRPDSGRLTISPAVALMPTEDDRSEREKKRVDSLATYGVYTLFYGFLRETAPDGRTAPYDEQQEAALYTLHLPLWDMGKAYPRSGDKKGEVAKNIEKFNNLKAKIVDANSTWPEGRREYHPALRNIVDQIDRLHGIWTETDEKDAVQLRYINDYAQALMSALKSIFFCAKLMALGEATNAWRADWAGYPNIRDPGGKKTTLIHIKTSDVQTSWLEGYALELRRHKPLLRNLEFEQISKPDDFIYDGVPPTDRFFAGAPSPALMGLRAALARLQEEGALKKEAAQFKKRVFFLLGKRGIGRGQVFSAMQSDLRFAQLANWLGHLNGTLKIDNDQEGRKGTDGIHRAFINLGVSHEVLSVVDSLNQFLENCIATIFAHDDIRQNRTLSRKDWERDRAAVQDNRLLRFEINLKWLEKLGKLYPDRSSDEAKKKSSRFPQIVIIINHFSVLFSRSGWPKNGQAKTLFNLICDSRFRNAPVDWILLYNEDQYPQALRHHTKETRSDRDAPKYRASVLMPAGMDEDDIAGISERLKRRHMRYSWHVRTAELSRNEGSGAEANDTSLKADPNYRVSLDSFKPAEELELIEPARDVSDIGHSLTLRGGMRPAKADDDLCGIFIHFLSPMNAGTICMRFYPRSTAALFEIAEKSHRNSHQRSNFNLSTYGFHEQSKVRTFQVAVRKSLHRALNRQERARVHLNSGLSPEQCFGVVSRNDKIEEHLTRAFPNFIYQYKEFKDKCENSPHRGDDNGESEEKAWIERSVRRALIVEASALSLEPSGEESDLHRKFKRIEKIAGHSRYAMTLIFALIDDMIMRRWHGQKECQGGDTATPITIDLRPIELVLGILERETAGLDQDQRPDEVIRIVLEVYRNDMMTAQGQLLAPWPFTPWIFDRGDVLDPYSSVTLRLPICDRLEIGKPEKLPENLFGAKLVGAKLDPDPDPDPDPDLSVNAQSCNMSHNCWFALEKADAGLLFDLQERILVTMSLIGQPVDATVLTGVSDVAAALEAVVKNITDQIGQDEKEDWQDLKEDYQPFGYTIPRSLWLRQNLVLRVLDLMVHRGFIFRIAAKNEHEGAFKEDSKDFLGIFPVGVNRIEDLDVARRTQGAYGRVYQRYATHKTMRRYIFRAFKAPLIDYAEIDQLTVSLYISQPSDLPRPSSEAHFRIKKIIDQLSLFEREEREVAHQQVDPFQTIGMDADDRRRVERGRLRAAYGVIRSIYSLGVVSRLDTSDDTRGSVYSEFEGGHFEAQRQRVRWMTRKAQQLDGQSGHSAPPATPLSLHTEELIWLFNECGVLSFAEGRISDARSLLLQAQKVISRHVESKKEGPLFRRVQLNRVPVEIESGNLRDAQTILKRLSEVTDDTAIFSSFVTGYRGVLDYTRGNLDLGSRRLRAGAEGALELKRYRAAAIFRVHEAICNAELGPKQIGSALSLINEAMHLAAVGQHEDVRYQAMLFQESIMIDRALAEKELPPTRIHERLEPIERYANRMGMLGLMARCELCRARYFQAEHNFEVAGKHAREALSLATSHGMALIKIEALLTLGVAMQSQRFPNSKLLLDRARDLAGKSEYFIRIAAIESAISRDG